MNGNSPVMIAGGYSSGSPGSSVSNIPRRFRGYSIQTRGPMRSYRRPLPDGDESLWPSRSIEFSLPAGLACFRPRSNCSGRLGSRYMASLKGLRFRIDAKAFRMRGNLNALELARIGKLGAQVDLCSYFSRQSMCGSTRMVARWQTMPVRHISASIAA